jgi:hypothetical protein
MGQPTIRSNPHSYRAQAAADRQQPILTTSPVRPLMLFRILEVLVEQGARVAGVEAVDVVRAHPLCCTREAAFALAVPCS